MLYLIYRTYGENVRPQTSCIGKGNLEEVGIHNLFRQRIISCIIIERENYGKSRKSTKTL